MVETGKKINNRVEETHLENDTTTNAGNDTEDEVEKKEEQTKDNFVQRSLTRYGRWAQKVNLVNMGIPFNRFIAFTASYLIFLMIIITLILKPIVEHHDSSSTNEHPLLKWTNCHYLILIYVLALLEKDFENFYRVKCNVFSNFWRAYDLAFHLFFVLHLILHACLQMMKDVDRCIGKEAALAMTTMPRPNDSFGFNNLSHNCNTIQTTISLSGVVFAIGKLFYTSKM